MDKDITRRKMLLDSALLAGGMCLCNTSANAQRTRSTCCETPELEPDSYEISEKSISVDLKKAVSLDKPGYAAAVVNADKNIQIIVVRTGKKEYVALHRLCTHGGQVVSYNSTRKILQCNSYNHSIFALNGEVVKGPAPKPLKVYPVKISRNMLEIILNGDA
ncbi:Rieske (2Fe-2S) protein [bacterium]|nr:Rieske (2Fe-2S) protein [bacterium]